MHVSIGIFDEILRWVRHDHNMNYVGQCPRVWTKLLGKEQLSKLRITSKNWGGKKKTWFWVGLQVSKNTRIPTTPSLKPKGSDEHELSSVVLGNQCFVDNQKQGEIVLFKNKTEKKMFKNIAAINLHDQNLQGRLQNAEQLILVKLKFFLF